MLSQYAPPSLTVSILPLPLLFDPLPHRQITSLTKLLPRHAAVFLSPTIMAATTNKTPLISFESQEAFKAYAIKCTKDWEKENAGEPVAADSTSLTRASAYCNNKPCLFSFSGGVFDATSFVLAHPGGESILHIYNGKDVSDVFYAANNPKGHVHTTIALNMLLGYRIGTIKGQEKKGGAVEVPYPLITEEAIIYRDFVIRRDKGLIWQCMNLSYDQYSHCVATAVFLPYCRLFDSNFLEFFTKTKFYVVAVLWTPLSIFWLMKGILTNYSAVEGVCDTLSAPAVLLRTLTGGLMYGEGSRCVLDSYLYKPNNFIESSSQTDLATATANSSFNVIFPLMLYAAGFVLWTLLEYCLHRTLFHFDRLIPRFMMSNPISRFLHLVIHGIHHIIPMDPDRLVFPPVLFVIVCSGVRAALSLFMMGSTLDIFLAGLVLGYLSYDMSHYTIHQVDVRMNYYIELKKFHHLHHYLDDNKGFGISNKFWDWVFGTTFKTTPQAAKKLN